MITEQKKQTISTTLGRRLRSQVDSDCLTPFPKEPRFPTVRRVRGLGELRIIGLNLVFIHIWTVCTFQTSQLNKLYI